MRETELKILDIDVAEVTEKLTALGAKKIGEYCIVGRTFDFADGRIKGKKDTFRLRKLGEKTFVTYKYGRSQDTGFLIGEELETEVENFEVMESILERLGLKCIRHQEKKRTSFERDSLKFEIDEYPTIPPYLEIEGKEEDIQEAVKLLGFDMNETVALTATEVLRRYGVNPDLQKFEKV